MLARTRPEPFVTHMPEDLGGLKFSCDLADAIARDVALVGVYEPQETQLLTQLLEPGMTMVDVGANWGFFTLLAAHLVGVSGRVLSFEPDPRLFPLLQRNVSLNTLPQVSTLPLAVGALRGTVTLEGYDPSGTNRGLSRVNVRADPGSDTTFVVQCETLDEVVADREMDVVDLVKIDVEGAEDAVLAGMADGLRAHRYHRLLLELHPALLEARGVTVEECCATLRNAGYIGWTLDHSARGVQRATNGIPMRPRDLLTRADRPDPSDPWPHMLWAVPGMVPLDAL
jgi:FkbM family methyltransferase